MTIDNSKALDNVLVKQEITEQIYKYCRAMDRIDNDLANQCFHKDSTVDYGGIFNGTGEEFVEWVSDIHQNYFLRHSHQVTNITISFEGVQAASESYLTLYLRSESEVEGKTKEQVLKGRYLDLWSYENNRWVIKKRRQITDFSHTKDMTDDDIPSDATRDKTDPSYSLLSEFKL